MVKRFDITNLTVFRKADFRFCDGVNVVIGENGSGKSHLLKVAYALIAAGMDQNGSPSSARPVKSTLQRTFGTKLVNVMRPEYLGRLQRRRTGRQRCELALEFEDSALDCAVSFTTGSKSDVNVDGCPSVWQEKAPVFLPPHELLTLYPGFVAFYDGHYLEFDEIHRDCQRSPERASFWTVRRPQHVGGQDLASSARASLDERARSRCQGLEPCEAGAERSDAP